MSLPGAGGLGAHAGGEKNKKIKKVLAKAGCFWYSMYLSARKSPSSKDGQKEEMQLPPPGFEKRT